MLAYSCKQYYIEIYGSSRTNICIQKNLYKIHTGIILIFFYLFFSFLQLLIKIIDI